jgi:dienelactone hydrolase
LRLMTFQSTVMKIGAGRSALVVVWLHLMTLDCPAHAQKILSRIVTFSSLDRLPITADFYPTHRKRARGFLLLCHQARWSRGEYRETARWLSQLGFGVLAVDLRSGGEVNGVINQTFTRAKQWKRPTDYLSARQDLEAAIRYITKTYHYGKLILVGSSYSAGLVLRLAGERKLPIDGVVAFSPGEYFPEKNYLVSVAGSIQVPVWITSARGERDTYASLVQKIPRSHLTVFVPKQEGFHGARALWETNAGHEAYRGALMEFLNRHFR